jgi:general secretion pathway protein A
MNRFRFQSLPFTREINIEHRLRVAAIEAAVSSLKTAIDERQSAALVAPAGAGKTLALRTLKAMLPEARYRTTYIKLTNLSRRDMYREVALALRATPAGMYPRLVRSIEERLRSGFEGDGCRQVILFDDAHEMRADVLGMIRLLTNFEMDSKLVVSIILCGQLPLKKLMMGEDLVDVRQRLAYCAELGLLTREETKAYVEHRVKIAGAPQVPFDAQAIDALFEITHGNMRAIDKLALAALRAADNCQKPLVDAADVAIARSSQWM